MTALRTLIVASILSSLPVGAAFAEADRTGTGSGPLSTEKPPNITITGQTKSPSQDASSISVAQPSKRDVRLEELQAAPRPRQQSDLDTVALASAHREQAKSMEEKTDGLWQSWLVSVCDGCGDQKPPQKVEDWPSRDVSLTTGSISPKASPDKVQRTEVKRTVAPRHGSLQANLSPENVGSIRRMPQR